MYKCFISLLLSFACLAAKAGPDESRFRFYNIESGLPTNNIYSVIQDRLGYIWFATDNGAIRYNGYSFKIFNTSNGLPSNDVWRLEEDNTGRLWVFSSTYSFGYIRDDEFHELRLPFKDRVIYPFYYTNIGDKVFCLIIYNKTTHYVIINGEDSVFTMNVVPTFNDCVLDGDGRLWDFNNDTLHKLTLFNNKLVKKIQCILPVKNYFDAIRASAIVPSRGLIYSYAFNDRFLYLLDTRNCTIQTLDLSTTKKDETILLLRREKDDYLLITNKNLYQISGVTITGSDTLADKLMTGTQVTYRKKDNNENLWYSSNTAGVAQSISNPLPDGEIAGHFKDLLPVGKNTNGISYWWDKKSSEMVEMRNLVPVNRNSYPHLGSLKGVQPSLDNPLGMNLVFASGIYTRETKKKDISKLINQFAVTKQYNNFADTFMQLQKADTFSFTYINTFSAHQYRPDTFYSISFIGFLRYVMMQDTLEIKTLFSDRFTGLSYDTLLNIYWLYNAERILVYDPIKNKSIVVDDEMLGSLGIGNVKNIKTDNTGCTFILSDDRLTMVDLKHQMLSTFFANYNLSRAHMDIADSFVVVAGNFGLGMLHFDKGRYLEASWVNTGEHYYKDISSLLISDDRVAITSNEESRIYEVAELNAFLKRSSVPPIRLVCQNQLVKTGDTIFIPPGINKLSIDAINLAGSGNIQYRYKIDGRDDVWQTSASGEIIVADLLPGKRYPVICSIKDNIFQNTGVQFFVYQIPRWYETPGFRVIFILSAIACFVLSLFAVSVATRRLVARSSERKRVQTELELRAIHSQINPHFIFNTLATALFFISKQQTKEAYEHVSKFSKLLRSYLKSSRERLITLADEIQMLQQYVDLQKTRLKQGLDFEIVVAPELLPTHVLLPSLLLQPLVENAIHHGLFNKREKGMLRIVFTRGKTETELVCIIEDNGIGRIKAKAIKQKYAGQASYGGALTNELIEVFKKYEQMNIAIEYIDKELPETGTIVRLTIKNVKTAPAATLT
jgi:two-component sensor histidine kinase